jgi:ribose transport system ATP-binding protein
VADAESILQLEGICKSFGATRALHNVNLNVRAGRVHALIGENGAGKSTLMKVLSGAHRSDQGRIVFGGRPVQIGSPSEGRRMGVAMIYQELTLAPHLSVEENLTLGLERTRAGVVRKQRDKIRPALELLQHPDLPLSIPVRDISIGLQQVVEIARALISDARAIIMDEPTSSLTAADTRSLFQAIGRLKESGIAVIYISHFLEEVREIADDYTVLRDGETVGAGLMSEVTLDRIIELMVGRTLNEMFPKIEHTIGAPLMTVVGLSGAKIPNDVSFAVRRGEILGLAGLVGSGRSETVRSLFGLHSVTSGRMTIAGRSAVDLRSMRPRRALAAGIDFLSENRKEEGLAVRLPIDENTVMSSFSRFAGANGWGLLGMGRIQQAVRHWIGEMNIRCQGPHQPVQGLSGGNQQKVALARILQNGAEVVLLDEPTRGVDVGSKVEIYRLVGRLAAAGKAVVFVSSYLPELLGVCDSLAVMHRGAISPVRPVSEWNEKEIMRIATSGN